MVYRMDPEMCLCGSCNGGQRAPKGVLGGSYCPCQCHSLKGKDREDFIAARSSKRLREITNAIIESANAARIKSQAVDDGMKGG